MVRSVVVVRVYCCCSCLLCLPYWGGALLNIRRHRLPVCMYEVLVARQLPKMVIACMETSWYSNSGNNNNKYYNYGNLQ